MKIGIIYTGFNTEKYIHESLYTWLLAKQDKLGGNEFVISVTSVPFIKFNIDANKGLDGTHQILEKLNGEFTFDYFNHNPTPVTEVEARSAALKYLVGQDVDYVWQVDSDEFYTSDDILRIIKFLSFQKLVPCFRLSLKNYVFDENTYLIEPFCPMRIHKVKFNSCVASEFYDDNNIFYLNEGTKVYDVQIANMTIPASFVWIKHLTWLSDDRSKRKVAYQRARGWECSFKWDEENNKLEFNPDFYRKRSQNVPKVLSSVSQ